jgi:hypothetical protein
MCGEDKQRAVKAALGHPNGAGKSNSAIARHVGVDEGTVRSWREKMAISSEIPKIDSRTVTRNGITYQQNTANIGKRKEDFGGGTRVTMDSSAGRDRCPSATVVCQGSEGAAAGGRGAGRGGRQGEQED